MSSKAAKRRKFTVQDYHDEVVWIGGMKTTRGQFIKEMRAAGHPQQRIDIYLRGWDQGRQVRSDAWVATFEEEALL